MALSLARGDSCFVSLASAFSFAAGDDGVRRRFRLGCHDGIHGHAGVDGVPQLQV